MSLETFIPSVWSARILANLHKAQVFAQPGVVNSDYTGDILHVGDSVRIHAIGAITVSDYTKNTDISAPEALTDAELTLNIDQGKYFNFQIDDIDAAQGQPRVMDEAMREAAYAISDAADTYVAGLYTDAASANLIGSTASPKTDLATAGQPYVYLTQLKQKLDEANVPKSGRFVVIPPWYEAYLLQDQRFVSFGTAGNLDTLRNGAIGRAAGFDILVSNNVANTTSTKYRIIAGSPMAWAFADQITEIIGYRPERRFADAMKGLHVYGAKVVRPSAMAVLTANPT
jgi:hypothetical protein